MNKFYLVTQKNCKNLKQSKLDIGGLRLDLPNSLSLNRQLKYAISSRVKSQAEVKYVCKRQGGCDITLRFVSTKSWHEISAYFKAQFQSVPGPWYVLLRQKLHDPGKLAQQLDISSLLPARY